MAHDVKFEQMKGDRITPDVAIKLRDSMHIAVLHYADQIVERAVWSLCDRERAELLVSTLRRVMGHADPLVWSAQTWDLAQGGAEAFNGTRADDDCWRIGGAQHWMMDGFRIGWRDDRSNTGLELDGEYYCDQLVLLPSIGAHDGSLGLTFAHIYFPTLDEVGRGTTPLPVIRAFPRMKPGMELFSTYTSLSAALAFLRLDFVVRDRQRPSWNVEKAYQRAKRVPPTVGVVKLRRSIRDQHGAPNGSARDWSCQWPVRGHWRKQWYRSDGEHRPRWIMPYIKGPSDKPLKDASERVMVVVR